MNLPRRRQAGRWTRSVLIASALLLAACTPTGQSLPPEVTPAGGATLSPQACQTWQDDLVAHFDGIAGIQRVAVEPKDDLCAGTGSYTIEVHADAAPTAATITATWDAFAEGWEALDLESVAARYPTLVVNYGESLIETSHTVIRLDDRTSNAIAGLTAGTWRAVFRANFAGMTDYAEVPADRQVLRLWLTEDPQAGLEPIADTFVPMWQAAAEAADAVGWYRGEIGLSAYSAGNMTLPVPPAAPVPDGLAAAFVAGHDFTRVRGSIGPGYRAVDLVRVSVELSFQEESLDEATQARLDALVANIEALGFTVETFVGHRYE